MAIVDSAIKNTKEYVYFGKCPIHNYEHKNNDRLYISNCRIYCSKDNKYLKYADAKNIQSETHLS
jgi:hypothetical protein